MIKKQNFFRKNYATYKKYDATDRNKAFLNDYDFSAKISALDVEVISVDH